jgi:uncharacterized MnhB-related membrane protein
MLNLIFAISLFISAIVIIFQKNKFILIIYYALFSFIAASIYFINNAPDIALAEIAIGCAFIPLIYLISVTRQDDLVVLFHSKKGESAYCDPLILIEFMGITEKFCEENGLSLKIINKEIDYEPEISGIFRPGNIDIIANYDDETKILKLTGNRMNIFIPRIGELFHENKSIVMTFVGGSNYED